MKGVREPWMLRAAILMMVIGLSLAAWTVVVVWAYLEVRPFAPDWLSDGPRSPLAYAFGLLWMCVGGAWAVWVWTMGSRVAGIPLDAADPGHTQGEYPFHNRRLSKKAREQAGQEGYLHGVNEKLDRVIRQPLSPPDRGRPPPY